MIRIQNIPALILSCQISDVTILTDKEFVDISVRSSTQTLLDERYFASDNNIILYDVRSLLEQFIRDAQIVVETFSIIAQYLPTDGESEVAEVNFSCIFCSRDIDIFDIEPLLKSCFLTSATARRVAPECFLFLPYFAFAGESIAYYVYCDYCIKDAEDELKLTSGYTSFLGGNANTIVHNDDFGYLTIYLPAVTEQAEKVVGKTIEVTAMTIRMGNRAASFFIDKSLSGTRPFYFRNCFNVPDNFFVPAVTTAKTKVDRSLAVLGKASQFYDTSCEQSFEIQSAGLTHDECSLAEQMFCSDDVRTPFESAPDDADFDALRQVLISDSTSEIVDIPEKPCQVKFTWRYASNRIAQKNPVKDELFTEQYNYSFK